MLFLLQLNVASFSHFWFLGNFYKETYSTFSNFDATERLTRVGTDMELGNIR